MNKYLEIKKEGSIFVLIMRTDKINMKDNKFC